MSCTRLCGETPEQKRHNQHLEHLPQAVSVAVLHSPCVASSLVPPLSPRAVLTPPFCITDSCIFSMFKY